MRSRPALTRRLAPAVLAAYLVATTTAGLFHRHGDECCRHTHDVAAKTQCGHDHAHPKAGCRHAHHCGQASHSHDYCRHGEKPTDRSQRTPRIPCDHDDCAVCRFLANHAQTPAVVVFETSTPLVGRAEQATPGVVPTVREADHPARGPPHLS